MKLAAVLLLTLIAGCSNTQPTADPTPQETIMAPTTDVASEDVQFEAAGMTVFGTLTRPTAPGRYPGVAIAAGSGPTDRDWRNPIIPGPNGSASLLADALARAGVVVLRYDKRGTGQTGMPPAAIKWGDYAAELSAAVRVLADSEHVDPSAVYVAGHSEGGAHALRVAANSVVPIAGLILLSTSGRTLRDIVLWQISNQISGALDPAAAKLEIDALTLALDDIAAGKPRDARTVGTLPGVQQFVMALQNPQSVGFARGLLTFDPLAAFASFEGPVLVLNGDRDVQVDPELDARPLAAASEAAGHETTLVIVATADHVLKVEDTPKDQLTAAIGAPYNDAGRVLAPEVPAAIAAFVTTRD